MKMRIAVAAALLLALVASSTADAKKITGKNVKNGSLTGKDIKNGSIRKTDIKKNTISLKQLSPGVRALILISKGTGARGPVGPRGPAGPAGGGTAGGAGGADFAGPNWAPIFRNTIGSPDINLAGGPNVAGAAATSTPPFGTGSLQFTVADGPNSGASDAEKVSFGNQVDFAGKQFDGLDQLGFQVFTTGENTQKGNPNMPGITIEIDPNLNGVSSNFSSLVYEPPQSPSNQWSGYINATTTPASATGTGFYLTGPAGAATNCTLAAPCTFSDIKAKLNDNDGDPAIVGSVAVTKGRDFAFQGAVDGLRVSGLGKGDQTFDFEPNGTTASP